MINKIKLLLIEDSPVDAKQVSKLLLESQSLIFDIMVVDTLSAAISSLSSSLFDIMLLDLNLSDSRGFETFNAINKLELDIPVIILSSSDDEDLSSACVRSGAQDYLVKGTFDSRLLLRIIRYAIERNESIISIKQYAYIVDNSDRAIFYIDLNGVISTWNKGAEKTYGYITDNIVNKNISVLFDLSERDKVAEILKTISEGTEIAGLEARHVREDGKELIVRMRLLPIMKDHDKSMGAYVLISDITSQQLNQKLLAIHYRVTAILHETRDLRLSLMTVIETICEIFEWDAGEVWLVDEASNTLRVANKWSNDELDEKFKDINLDVFLHPNEDIAGQTWNKKDTLWIKDMAVEMQGQSREKLLQVDLRSVLGLPITFHDKTLGVMLFYSKQMRKPGEIFLNIFKAIGDLIGGAVNRGKLEEKQLLLQSQLYIKNKELEEQMAFLRQANHAKSTFIANMSHELRSPLNTIIGFSELIQKQKTGAISEPQQDAIDEVVKSSHHLLNLVNQILDLSRIEAGKMECKTTLVNINQIIKEVYDAMRLNAEEKNISIVLDKNEKAPENISTDGDKLRQIVINYLSNAIKFTPSGGKIVIRISPENNDFVRISVTDTGTGISKNDIDKLFIEFGQLNISYSKTQQGIGLGLALSKHLAELLGGSVGVTSELGKGSTFYVTLPITMVDLNKGNGKLSNMIKE